MYNITHNSFRIVVQQTGSCGMFPKCWKALHKFFLDFCPNLQSGANQSQSADTGQCELTDITVNCVVYDGHGLRFLASYYESVQSEDFKHV